MFHNSPKKFPQFFKPSVVFPMGLLLSRCKLMSPAKLPLFQTTHGESNQRNHDKDMAARVHRSHDTHDTFFPPSTRWRSPRCRGRERGLKCRNKNAHPFFRSVGINMNQRFFFWGGGLRLTSIHESIYPSWFIWFVCCLGFCSLHLGEFWWPWRFLHVWKDMDTWSRT